VAKGLKPADVFSALAQAYPDASCSLDFQNPYQLLVATILSAQCTDERVNQVTPALFRRCPDAKALAALPQQELEALIRSTGFFRNKARSLKGAAEMLVREYGGEIPRNMEELTSLPGVARKTANVVLGTAFGRNEGVVVDTHVKRLAGRMGLSGESDPEKIERDLMGAFPRESWSTLGHRLIHHGRTVCRAVKPGCGRCVLQRRCPKLGL
jgi:endonuclease-3